MRTSARRRLAGLSVAAAVFGSLTLTACGGDSGASGASDDPKVLAEGVDDGTTLTMWTRSQTATASQGLVDAYNASHENQVQLTVVPTESYLQKVGVAAGSNELPDLLASDVIYAPNFTSKNIFQEITERVDALPYGDKLAPSHMELGTWEGEKYTVPHNLAVSVLAQNDVLLEKAGIDPSVQPKSLKELADNARKVAALGGDSVGLYYTGNNGGSIAFTHFPSIWAADQEVLSDDGDEALLDSDAAAEVFGIYNQLDSEGVSSPSVRNETGATRNEVFAKGNVGYMLASNSVVDSIEETDKLKVGVHGIPGPDGGVSTFVGGDVIGISSSSEHADAAWNFLAWSESDEAQLEVFAKTGQLTTRTDLAENEYTKDDPRLVTLNELVAVGRTPFALNFGQTFNDPNGPWIAAARDALFGDDPAAALKKANDSLTAALSNQ
jgi:multiple sugar transport system substrate-binding protein